MTAELPLPKLPARPADGHKGTFGTVIVVGGSRTMLGAPTLTASAALRAGCGLVKIAASSDILPFCLTIEPSATGIALPEPEKIDGFSAKLNSQAVLAIGPGMGEGDYQKKLIIELLGSRHPIVLDADGLNNMAAMDLSVANRNFVVTPHPGEFKRLAAKYKIKEDPTSAKDRPAAASALARALKAVVVLKGDGTVISDGSRTVVNKTGNVALAIPGSGDVLTGLIASLMAQGMDAFAAARLGTHIHGICGDIYAERHGPAGLKAAELADLIPQALARF
jgi:ADP-dependent NAD(P)H-hydrate dehydratase